MKQSIANQPFTTLTMLLEKGEAIKCQSGAMSWMSPGIKMETKTGGLGGMFKKALTGESLALNHYTAEESGSITLSKKCPGDILIFDIAKSPIVAQKNSFLAAVNNPAHAVAILWTGLEKSSPID